MTDPRSTLEVLAPALSQLRRGIEKEGLRVLPSGSLALTPHPLALGSALTHPHITTDYSESQLELITGVHASVESTLAELTEVHQYTVRTLRSQTQVLGPGLARAARAVLGEWLDDLPGA